MAYALSDEEREFLAEGIGHWGGPARSFDTLARLMGFDDKEDLLRGEGPRIAASLRAGDSVPPKDLMKALIATELLFGSSRLGAANDWSTVSGLNDLDCFLILRSLQHKLASLPTPEHLRRLRGNV